MVFAYTGVAGPYLCGRRQTALYAPWLDGSESITNEVSLDTYPYDRETVFPSPEPSRSKLELFKLESGNERYRTTFMTWVSLFILLVGYQALSVLGGDPTEHLKSLDSFMLMVLLIGTVVLEWLIFAILYGAISLEHTGLAGVGLRRFRLVDVAWGLAFFPAAWLLLSGLAWVLGKVGLPMPGEIELLIPKDPAGRVVWFFVALTAGFCEEVAFRGYLMTRLRLVAKLPNWIVPTIISGLAFGACHAYQGIPGIIVISVYGILFSLLYIRTGSLWPCIIAHFLQDFGALFVPR